MEHSAPHCETAPPVRTPSVPLCCKNTFHGVHAPPHQQLEMGPSPASASGSHCQIEPPANLRLVITPIYAVPLLSPPLPTSHTVPLCRLLTAPEIPKGDGTSYNPPQPATAQPPKHLTSTGSSSKAPHSAETSQPGYGVSCPYLLHPAPRVEHFPVQDSRG